MRASSYPKIEYNQLVYPSNKKPPLRVALKELCGVSQGLFNESENLSLALLGRDAVLLSNNKRNSFFCAAPLECNGVSRHALDTVLVLAWTHVDTPFEYVLF
jgi:hypothetical protein